MNPNTGENPGQDAKTRVARNTVFMDASQAERAAAAGDLPAG